MGVIILPCQNHSQIEMMPLLGLSNQVRTEVKDTSVSTVKSEQSQTKPSP